MVSSVHISKTGIFHLIAPPSRVFPLLCPVREYEWVEGWSCDLVHSMSGYAEPGCIFTTQTESEGFAVWIMTDYQPDAHIHVIKACTDLYLLEWTFDLEEAAENKTDLKITFTMTGLSEVGNRYTREFMNEIFPRAMDRLEESLNYFLQTGRIISSVSAEVHTDRDW